MMLVVQATQHHVVGWRDSDKEERIWKDAVMPNGGTEENNEKPQVRIVGLLVWTKDLQNKEYYPPACKILYEKTLNWWILHGVLLSCEMSITLHCFSHSQSKNTRESETMLLVFHIPNWFTDPVDWFLVYFATAVQGTWCQCKGWWNRKDA